MFAALIVLLYTALAAFSIWLAWQFVYAFVRIAQSLEDIAATYRRNSQNPPYSSQGQR